MEDSLKKRYVFKLLTNLIGLFVSLFTQTMIPRGLGPKAYGDFTFLRNFFSQLIPYIGLGSGVFYVRLSQRQDDFGLVSFRFQLTGLGIIAVFIFIAGSQLTGVSNRLWIHQNIFYVYMAAVWAILVCMTGILNEMADAYGLTVATEMARIGQKFFGLLIIIVLFLLNQLNLANFFFYHYAILLVQIILFIWIIGRSGHSFSREWRLRKSQMKGYAKEFYDFLNPLILVGLIGQIIIMAESWLLQKYGGSVQQGFFGLSYQIGVACFLFTSAMTSLIQREFSIAFGKNDLREMARLFRRYIPMLYSIAAFLGCFACLQAEKIIYIFGGSRFAGAALPMMIMALYPIHQTYGQLSGSVYFATDQTKLYRNITAFDMVLRLPMTYILLAPTEQFGLNAGAVGLAVKFVVLQFIIVNVQLYFNARLLNLRFIRYLGHQILCVGCLLGIALLSKMAVGSIELLQDKIIINFILSGIIYAAMVVILGYFLPIIFGLQRGDMANLISRGVKVLKRA